MAKSVFKGIEIKGIAGVHVMAFRQEETVAEIIQKSGVLNGRVPWYPGRDKSSETDNQATKELA